MSFYGDLKRVGWFFLLLFIINGHEIQAVDLPTTKTASPETVFGGVGRPSNTAENGFRGCGLGCRKIYCLNFMTVDDEQQ